MSNAPLRLAIIGCGAITEIGYMPALQNMPDFHVHALIDSDLIRAKELAGKYGVPCIYLNISDVLKEVDAVVIATPPHIRPEIAEKALSHGLHVLCEKPLANSKADCEKIVRAAEKSGCVLAVAHTFRFYPNRNYVYELIKNNALGKINTVNIEEGSPADWPTKTGYTFRKEMVPGGVLLNNGIHSLDTLFWWFGEPLEFVYKDDSIGGLESNARIEMKYHSDIEVKFRLSRTCHLDNKIIIICEKGQICLPIYDPVKIEMHIDGENNIKILTPNDFGFVDAVVSQLRDFAESIMHIRLPRVTGIDGLKVIGFIERCYCIKRSRPIPERVPIPGIMW